MNIRTVCGALILSGLIDGAASSTLSLAQSKDKGVSAAKGCRRKKSATESDTERATLNINTNPTKHRYWRHRGGKHPHFGSRRARTQVQHHSRSFQPCGWPFDGRYGQDRSAGS